ncbi:MAG: leucyl aminopeptidase [Actinomycetota bacterium]|nr:leucyl aminopeptidase [Actinomycetota bacterium]
MATLTLSGKSPSAVHADAVVVAVGTSLSGARLLGADALPDDLRTLLTDALGPLGVTGAADSVHRVPAGGTLTAPVVVLTGVGDLPSDGAVPDETLRRAAGAAARSLAGTGTVAFAMPADNAPAVAAVAEGALLGAYSFGRYRTTSALRAKAAVNAVVVLTPSARGNAVRTAVRRAEILAGAVNAARDLVNTSPADLYPATFAAAASEAVADLPVTVTVLDEDELARGGYGGLVAVGQGSVRPPRLVRLDYVPENAVAHLAYVGKGITFDSGGLSIKPAAGMDAMKNDMSGAAAVLHTVVAAATLGLPVRVTGWLALAENMPSGSAQRPSDVITIRGGRTVEVLNTDAEGRLVLADAIVAAGEENPDLIVDVATLTGAQVVALGNRMSAVMANDDTLRTRIHQIADAVGEQFWPMPLPPELRSSLDSPVADLANMGERFGGMLTAGIFLSEFVPKIRATDEPDAAGQPPTTDESGADETRGTAVPWAHLDIAGPSFNGGSAYGYTPVGGTGVAVRTLLGLVEDIAVDGI